MVGVSDILVSLWLCHANNNMVHQYYGHLLACHDDINKLTIT